MVLGLKSSEREKEREKERVRESILKFTQDTGNTGSALLIYLDKTFYLDITRALHNSNQLLVSWGTSLSHQRLSHCIVETIILTYNSKGTAPGGLFYQRFG